MVRIFSSIALLATLIFSSCSVMSGTGSHSNNAYRAPRTYIESANDYALDIEPEGITYTIDISTPEGAAKLDKISLKDAEDLALTEAVIKYNCAMLVNPQFTNLMNGKRVLRITVFGFPARYRARPDNVNNNQTPTNNRNININISNN